MSTPSLEEVRLTQPNPERHLSWLREAVGAGPVVGAATGHFPWWVGVGVPVVLATVRIMPPLTDRCLRHRERLAVVHSTASPAELRAQAEVLRALDDWTDGKAA